MKKLITVDIGNSFIKFGLFHRESGQQQLEEPVAVCVERTATFSDLAHWLGGNDGHTTSFDWVVSSVNQERTRSLKNWLLRNRPHDSVRLISLADIPMEIHYDYPERLGIDRAVAAWAAKILLNPSGILLIVDVGTATTIDLVNEKGVYCGGAIMPGPQISAEALFHRTAQLPRMEFRPMSEILPFVPPDDADLVEGVGETAGTPLSGKSPFVLTDRRIQYPATNTEDAIQVGICQGLAAAVFVFYLQVLSDCRQRGVISESAILLTGRSGELIENQVGAIFQQASSFFKEGELPTVLTCQNLILRGLASLHRQGNVQEK